MRDYGNRTPSAPRPDGAPPPTHPTRSVRTAALLAYGVAFMFAVSAALTLLQLNRVAELSEFGASPAQQAAARDSAMSGALFNLAVFGGVWAVLAWALRRGVPAARVVLTVLAILGAGIGIAGLLHAQPASLIAATVVQTALQLGILAFLWRPDASDYLRPRKR